MARRQNRLIRRKVWIPIQKRKKNKIKRAEQRGNERFEKILERIDNWN